MTNLTSCVWPHVTSVTTYDRFDHMREVWPHVISVITHDKCDHIMDIWTSWTLRHHRHLKISKEHIWKFFLMNIWNIVGRRKIGKFPSSFYKLNQNLTLCQNIFKMCPNKFSKVYKSYRATEVHFYVSGHFEVRHIILIKATDVGNRIQTDRGPFVL